MRLSALLPFLLLVSTFSFGAPKKCTISGYVYEEGSRKPIVYATIYVLDNKVGTVTNEQGYFALSVPVTASLKVRFSFVGFSPIVQTISLAQDAKLDIYLAPGELLNEQTVRATKAGSVSNEATMSTISITGAQLRKIPALFGEKNPLKMLQLMPGVQKGSEGNAGLYVRGGSPDGNLILLDDAPIYNPNHLLGFFSAFNGDVLKQVDLTKGGFPARFGGRLSSVVELTTKDGGADKLHGEGSLGLVASRLTLQGPLLSPKVSFFISGRRTYLDLLSGLIQKNNSAEPVTKSYFYDLNAKVTIDAGAADTMRSDLEWSNLAGSARWNHRFAGGTTANLSLIYSQYNMGVSDQQSLSPTVQNQLYTLRYQSGIRDLGIKYDINQYISDKHQFQYGIQVTHHQFTPTATITSALDTLLQQASTQTINALEAGVYGEHYWQPTDQLRINSGIRLSYYSALGTG